MRDTVEAEDLLLDVTLLTKIGRMVREEVNVDVNSEIRVGICKLNVDVDLVADVVFVFHVADMTRIFGCSRSYTWECVRTWWDVLGPCQTTPCW
jgi:hypothetical protein